MSYVALYRKYRPLDFNSLVGQDHITNILRNQIINGKVSHAYIFSGSRGTGKTSTAKIFSRAVNCLNPHEGNPCNECEACKSILNDDTTDVVEMDAASNNSVENIRAIRQEVMYATTNLKYKIYIIDEAHMLSTSAFNALLKTLEEPPENVIFILATTEEHKLLPTILSRCMRFEFKKISIQDVVQRIKYILEDSKIAYEEEALTYVANICDGGMRDALSILERCIDDENTKITLAKIQDVIGMSDTAILKELAESIIKYDLVSSNEYINKVLGTGKDVRYITAELLEIFMDMLINEDNGNKLRLNYIIKELSKLDASLRQAINVNILFKAKIIELCTKIIYEREEELLEKIEKLELKIQKLEEQGVQVVNTTNTLKEQKIEQNINVKAENVNLNKIDNEKKLVNMQNAGPFKEFDKLRGMVIERDNLQLYSALAGVKAAIDEGSVVFNTSNQFAHTILTKNENAEMLRDLLNELYGDKYTVKIEYVGESKANENKFESHMLNSNIPFTSID